MPYYYCSRSMAYVDTGPPLFAAVRAGDVEALRRELAAGVDPDMHELDSGAGPTPLFYAVCGPCGQRGIRESLECISVLLEAGASVDLVHSGKTVLHWIAECESAECQLIIAALLEAGADPNFTQTSGPFTGRSVLALAAQHGSAGAVRMLISAGAVDLDRALELAIETGKQRNCTPLLRAGAAIPATIEFDFTYYYWRRTVCAYLEKIRTAGCFEAYEKAHRQRLVKMFLPKFPALPIEMLERVLEFTWDIGAH